ncbi:MAG: hydroxyacylglutathione hydrolase [Vibrio sp.]
MLTVKSIPAFKDNYIWAIVKNDQCALVDPGESQAALAFLKENNLNLTAILITHHHHDHTGGVAHLVREFPKCAVIGPKNDPIAMLTHAVEGGEQIQLFEETFLVLNLPGHTIGHIGYVGDGKLFCGDVLFSAGCGRVFEGTMQDMYESLGKLQALPQETLIYCAHEYTSSNLSFALAVEPNNQQLQSYRDRVNRKRAQEKPTIPTSLRTQKQINPFLRCLEPEVMKAVANRTESLNELDVFTALRQWKDEF